MNQQKYNYKTLLLVLIVITLIGVLGLTVQASDNPIECEGEEQQCLFLPIALYIPPPHWKPVAEQQLPSNTITKFFDVAVCGEHYFAGSNEGLYRLDQENKKWVKVNAVPGELVVAGVAFRGDTCGEVYAAARGAGVWRGQEQATGWTWKRVDASSTADDDAARYVLVAEGKLFVAGDFGIRWSDFPNGEDPFNWQPTNISSLVYSITDNDSRLLASVWGDGVYEWKQNRSWVKTPGDPADTQIYQGASNSAGIAAGSQSGLLFSAEGSGTWQRVPPPLPQVTTYALLAHEGAIYAGQRGSPAYKSRNGISWEPLPPFPNLRPDGEGGFQVRGFDIGLTDGALYAATTSGVWRLVDSTLP